jgi:HAD superfamily hydrolase (TIGR01549 family)
MVRQKLYDRLKEYDLIVFDMDGTLYFQRGMQLAMAVRLMRHALTAKHGFRHLSLILSYRKLREEWDSMRAVTDDELFDSLSRKSGVSPEDIKDLISKWMFDEPMDVVRKCRDRDLIDTMEALKAAGSKIVIYSDYPTEEKCRAVGLEDYDQIYCGMDEIKTMKPNPSGLFYIMNSYGNVPAAKVIMVGDRDDRDGAAAKAAGTDSLILRRFKVFRYFCSGL